MRKREIQVLVTSNTKNQITNDRLLIKNYKLHYYKLKMINYKLQTRNYNKCLILGAKGGRTLHFVLSRLKRLLKQVTCCLITEAERNSLTLYHGEVKCLDII